MNNNPFKALGPFSNYLAVLIFISLLSSCSEDKEEVIPTSQTTTPTDTSPLAEISRRNFKMGFSSWPYGSTLADQDTTYTYLAEKGDIYSEHIDNKIPWSAWMTNNPLPSSFVNDIQGRKQRKIAGNQLLLSVSILNNGRSDLAEDQNGSPPAYDSINQSSIIIAYEKHLNYLITELQPDYLVIGIEVNELKINSPALWSGYLKLITEIRSRIKTTHPNLPLSESITLHNFFRYDKGDSANYVNEIRNYIEQNHDFAAISFYPFFKGLNSKADFQEAFDFLHSQISLPTAFVETTHLAEDLVVPALNLNIPSNAAQQNDYLETLLLNAYRQDYKFIIWWAHRDYDQLWNTFPAGSKDLGKIWRDTGLLDEDGNQRPAYSSWMRILGIN